MFNYKRLKTIESRVGNIVIGGEYPIRIQSMTNTNTNDTEASVEQVKRIVDAGADLVRLTAQGVREANNLENIENSLHAQGYRTPLVADIHFNARAAEAAAKYVEKVRINPGNFVDKVKKFEFVEYTDQEYQQEIEKIRQRLVPLLDLCRQRRVALRIGVNHGSLSDRILSRFGDTPQGMVESCMEFLHICQEEDFHDIVISMKASNAIVMTQSVRLLVERMQQEGVVYPLHLGVTEAGSGEDGRIKSAVGIGSLLADGIGDTIRVSLSEEPEYEIPVAQKLVNYIRQMENHSHIQAQKSSKYSYGSPMRQQAIEVGNVGGEHLPIVISDRRDGNFELDVHAMPDYLYVHHIAERTPRAIPLIVDAENWQQEQANTYPLFSICDISAIQQAKTKKKFVRISYAELSTEVLSFLRQATDIILILETEHIYGIGEQRAALHTLIHNDVNLPVIISRKYTEDDHESIQIKAGTDFGAVFLEGFGNGICLQNRGSVSPKTIDAYMLAILQASRLRTSKTEYISCPSCGRTLFDLQSTVADIQQATLHLKHLKIGVMGCIVNGPGEMADADYGYVGAEKGKISLYKKQTCVAKNIPTEQAVERLVQLIKECGDWVEPD